MPLQYRRRVANRKIPFYLMGDTKKIWGERGVHEFQTTLDSDFKCTTRVMP